MEGESTVSRVVPLPAMIDFGREICGDLAAGEQREWLVSNGIGGFASGTVSGLPTRRYHGLLVAALKPPLGRTLLVASLDETADYDGQPYPLATTRWKGGTVAPDGYRNIERFRLEGTTPVWTYAISDALLEKRVWMEQGSNTTYITYSMVRGSQPLRLAVKALVNYRDYHSGTNASDWRMAIEHVEHGLRVRAFDGAAPFYLLSSSAAAEPAHQWYRDFDLAAERARGLSDHEDHLHAGTFQATIKEGESLTLVLSTQEQPELDAPTAYAAHLVHEHELLGMWWASRPAASAAAPDWIRQLVLAAGQFIVSRPLEGDPRAQSVIAGYPWFGDWGRDTMIALPGLTLTTGRPDVAKNVLRTFARFASEGMLPNYFPDAGSEPEYNTVDATLWYFQAVRQYFATTQDKEFLREIFPLLADMVQWHLRGTRHNIHVDTNDGLLAAGAPGVQLTWMDARVGDRVITPRIGKPVEVNALWYSALVTMAQISRALDRAPASYDFLAKRAKSSFQKFWNASAGCCFDVIDGPQGNEAAVRPNQIFAVGLPESPLTTEQQAEVLDVCGRQLLTSFGLRSLAPGSEGYAGRYAGGPAERDAVYHQGTAWGWLLGPFALAHLRVHHDPAHAASFLEPMAHQLTIAGLGTASEVFDGDAPFTPRGCTAQAWTVAEVLRAWTAIAAERNAGALSETLPIAEATAATTTAKPTRPRRKTRTAARTDYFGVAKNKQVWR